MDRDLPAAGLPHPAVIAMAPLPGPRRTPHTLAYVRLGSVMAVYAVAGLKHRQLQLRAPRAANGEAGIELPDSLNGAVERAIFDAIRAQPELRRQTLRLLPMAPCVTCSEADLARKGVTP